MTIPVNQRSTANGGLIMTATTTPMPAANWCSRKPAGWALRALMSKRLSKPYQSGRSGYWLKVKNPDSPAMIRAREHFARLGP
jgi:hypothetical protein